MSEATRFIRGLRRQSSRVAAIVLVAFAAMLIQPCAMAMQPQPDDHPAGCVGEWQGHEETVCVSQPALDCVSGDWSLDGRDSFKSQFDMLHVGMAGSYVAIADLHDNRLAGRLDHPPPRGAPALNLTYCVFLK